MKMLENRRARALAWSSMLVFSLSGAAQAQRSGDRRQVSLPEGTVLRAELNDRLSSTDSRSGDRFTATIRSDRDGSRLPSDTEVVGQVTSVRRASEKQPATIDVDFRSLRLADGRTYPISASLASLDAKSVRRTTDGRLESRGGSSRDKTKFIGYGAGAGALIGVLSGGNILKGGLLGAAAGYLYGQLNKDKESHGRYSEVDLKPGTEFGVELNRRTVVALAADRSSRSDRDRRFDDQDARYRNRSAGDLDRPRDADIRVLVNDRDVRFGDSRPFVSAGRVMVPLVAVLDASVYRYDYDARQREITLHGDRGDTRLTDGGYTAWVNGERVRLKAPAQIIDGVFYVPVQVLQEATDLRSDWDANSRTLRLTRAPARAQSWNHR
jgi:hypothetical protein